MDTEMNDPVLGGPGSPGYDEDIGEFIIEQENKNMIDKEFEEEFKNLCIRKNVEACFVTFQEIPRDKENVEIKMFTGGHTRTCKMLGLYIDIQSGKVK
jgi:hypothetical protein